MLHYFHVKDSNPYVFGCWPSTVHQNGKDTGADQHKAHSGGFLAVKGKDCYHIFAIISMVDQYIHNQVFLTKSQPYPSLTLYHDIKY